MPLVTVLLPVHNGAKFLKEAVESVLCQTLTDFEFLIVDDMSVDESPTIIRSYSDLRIQYLRSDKRLKLAGALNLGIARAKGEFVARMDADDICYKDRLEKQVSHMRQHKDLLLCGSAIDYFGNSEHGRRVYPAGSEYIRTYLLFDNPFAHPTVMWRRDSFQTAELQYDVNYYPAEDYALWSDLVLQGNCDNLSEPLLKYRIHPASMTRSDSNNMDQQSMRIHRNLLALLGLNPTDEELWVHRYGCTNRLYPKNDTFALCKLGEWFLKLQKANSKISLYDDITFRRCLGELWYAACYHALQNIGKGILSIYFSKRITQGRRHRLDFDSLFLLAWMKRYYLSSKLKKKCLDVK